MTDSWIHTAATAIPVPTSSAAPLAPAKAASSSEGNTNAATKSGSHPLTTQSYSGGQKLLFSGAMN